MSALCGIETNFVMNSKAERFFGFSRSVGTSSISSCNSFDNSGLLNQGGLVNTNVDEVVSAGSAENISILFNPTDSAQGSTAEAVRIPAGETRYFALLADVTGASSTPNIAVKMQGDASFSAGPLTNADIVNNKALDDGDNWNTGRYVFATTAANADSWDEDDFIWSGHSTNSTQSIVDYDWFSGYLVPGLSNSDTGSTETLSL